MRALTTALVLFLSLPVVAGPITRDEVMVRAKAFAEHPWHCSTQNLTASCAGGYESAYLPGDYMGLPYDWGGYMALKVFDQGIQDGHGAGSYPEDGILSCTDGLDCSGYVSKAWDIGHYTTSSIPDITATIAQSQLLHGDVMNSAGYHVMIYSETLADGWPIWYEALGWNVAINAFGGWASAAGFTPKRYDSIQDTPKSDLGTPSNPIVVNEFPKTLQGDTTQSISDLFDACGAAISKQETGPEVVYLVEVTEPGTLSATVQDDAGVDIDVHIYSALETFHCEARHDTTVSLPVTCGTWYVVADTWSNGGAEFPGPYTLTIDLDPSGAGCGALNQPFTPGGGVGEPCGYPGDPYLPFCNPNLGGWACLYSGSDSFCTFNCATDADCAADFAGGCCGDIQGAGAPQDFFCLDASLCSPVVPPEDTVEPPPEDTTGPGLDTAGPGPDTLPGVDTLPGEDSVVPGEDAVVPGEDSVVPGEDAVVPGEDAEPVGGDDTAGATPDVSDETPASGDDSGACSVVDSRPDAAPMLLLVLLSAAALGAARRRRVRGH